MTPLFRRVRHWAREVLQVVALIRDGRISSSTQSSALGVERRSVEAEDALKAAYALQIAEDLTGEQLTRSLGLPAAMAATVITALTASGWIKDDRRGRMRLTQPGKARARELIRAHRLWERYLVERKGVSLDAVHAEADRHEHEITPDELHRLDAELGFPAWDPHGHLIPTARGREPLPAGKPLSGEAQPGTRFRIVSLDDEPASLLAQLVALGLKPDTDVEIIRQEPDILQVRVNDTLIPLARAAARHVSVVPAPILPVPLGELPAGNGTLLLLPIDQGLEHGPTDFFPNPASADPDYQCRLARDGGYSGIVFHIGLASKYMKEYAGTVPLILKLNGKTNIPPDTDAFSALDASVEDAVRIGADAVGYTLYVGSPSQARDFLQLGKVRATCDRYGMPLIVWSYPRGAAIDAKGGHDSIYAVDYAARVANELGADIVKLNVPGCHAPSEKNTPDPYQKLYAECKEWEAYDENEEYLDIVAKIVASAGKTMVLFSGGSHINDEDLLLKARVCMEAGATGLIFGRNMWQRPFEESLKVTEEIKQILLSSRPAA